MKHAPALIALVLLSTACAKVTPAEGDEQNVTIDPRVIADEMANSTAADAPMEADVAGIVPMRFHGRWGINEADCNGDLAAAKGLLTIDEAGMKFYESRATLKEERPTEEGFSGLFAFTGEGQEWEKVETLKRDGDKLTRSDDEGTYDYSLCV